MSIDLVASTDYRRIRAVLVVPNAVAHHRNRRRTLAIIIVIEQAADPRLHAKGPEKIAGDILTVAGVGRRLRAHAPDAEICIAGLQSGKVHELRRVRAKVPIRVPREQGEIAVLREATPVAAARCVSDAPQLV